MSIHTLRLQFGASFWDVLRDLYKLEALDEYSIPPDAILHDLEEHAKVHEAMLTEVARLTGPARTRVLPRVRL